MVLRNVAKTFSLEEQRQEINEIAVDLDAVNTTLTNWNAAQWDTAYSWGDHAQAGYLVATASSYNNSNWDTAYGWGDHAQGGYLTAYQTDAQIKSSYEANADTNAFTDALLTKLNGIETSATADQSASEIKTAYESNADTNAFTDALQTKLNGIETNATADQTASEIKTAYESNADTNAFTDALQTKLNGIAAGAEVNLDPGGTYGGAGTAQDPAIGSIQFKNTGNTFGGDSLFTYDNTNNKLSIGAASGSSALNVVRPGATSVDTAYFYASSNGADNRVLINTVANQGGNPFIRFDSGGSNMVIGQLWAGTTSNKLVLGTGETPSGVTGITIDGLGNVTANNLALNQTNTNASGASADSTVLDHYEEGTWTPGAGSNFSGAFTNAQGYYTRIGNTVFVTFQFNYPGLTDGTTSSQVTGLPFDAIDRHSGTGIEASGCVYDNDKIYLVWAEGGQGSMYVATGRPLEGSTSTSAGFIRGSLTYPVAT